MAIARVQTLAGADENDTTTFTAAFGSNITAVSTIAVFIGGYFSNAGQVINSVTDTLGNTYTAAGAFTIYNNAFGKLYYAKSPSGGANTITVVFSAAVYAALILAHELSGVDTTTPLDNAQSAIAGGEGANPSTGNITTVTASDYLFAAGTNTAGSVWTAGGSFTRRLSQAHVTYTSVFGTSEDQVLVSPGTIAGTFANNAGYEVCGIMAFKEASGGAAFLAEKNAAIGQAVNRASTY